MRLGLLFTVAAAVAAFTLAGAAFASSAGSSGLQHVTVIGDSVADAIAGDDQASALLRQGIDLDLEVAVCRRLEGQSCPPGPPTVIDLIRSKGSQLGPSVVIAVGYNDFQDQYAAEIEDVLAMLNAAGVRQIFWLTLRAERHPYLTMNDDIAAAAAKHPELTVIDWNVYSRSHPDWFQDDGLHLLGQGSEAMAALIHKTLLNAGVAAAPVGVATTVLPLAHHGKTYSARLVGRPGVPPYSWSLLARPPAGVHLEANGSIIGKVRARPGRYTLLVSVRDAAGSTAMRRMMLQVTR